MFVSVDDQIAAIFSVGDSKSLTESRTVALSAGREVSKYRLTGLGHPLDHHPADLRLQSGVGSASDRVS